MKAEKYLIVLFIGCIKTKQSSQIFNFVTQNLTCALPDQWWVMNYFKILQQSCHLLVLRETVKFNDALSQYIALLLQYIHRQEIIPVTELIIKTEKCNQDLEIPKSKLILFIAGDAETFLRLFHNAETCIPQWNTRAHFIIILQNSLYRDQVTEKALVLSLFNKLWLKKRVLNVVIVTRHLGFTCSVNEDFNSSNKVWMYNPFELQANKIARGNVYRFEYGHSCLSEFVDKRLKNVHGYPLQVSIFKQYPTAIPIYNLKNNSIKYVGMDGHVLSSMIEYFNFTIKIHTPSSRNMYGFVLPNGSIIGSLGDVAERRSEISFNSRFLMWYGTNNIEFSVPLASDELCIIAPKARKIPKWKNMLVCFRAQVWLSMLLIYISCATFFYLLHKYATQNPSVGCLPAFDIFQVFLLSPVNNPPKIFTQRLLFVSCLLFSVVLMNTFQGLLVTNITSPSYGNDIHTMDQLDHSNLHILTGSLSTKDMLRNGGYSISNKFHVFEGKREEMIKHVLNGDAAITERESSVRFLVTKYVSTDGTTLIHMIEECPAYYYLAYILPKNNPYLLEFNLFFRKVMESGLTHKWYWDAIDVKTRLTYKKSQFKQKTLKLFSLSDLQLAFYVLTLGMIISTAVFLTEIAV